MHLYEVLRRPLITEKNSIQQAQGKYVFQVVDGANKVQIKEAVENVFKVSVEEVNVMMVAGKSRRMRGRIVVKPSWKKAIVTLKAGDKIEIVEGV
jgi:large subunit ribosomal protein L23